MNLYDFYNKQSDKYYTALILPGENTTVKYIWEVTAKKVIVPGYEEYDLFMAGRRREFILYEALTGIVLIRQTNLDSRHERRCCAEDFKKILRREFDRRGGKAKINKVMNDFIITTKSTSKRYDIKTVKNEVI